MIVKTPPSTHQGVAIAFRRSRFQSFKLLHRDLHTPHTVITKLRLRNNQAGIPAELVVVGHYAQPSIKSECIEELKFFTENIRRDEPQAQVVLAGDLNSISDEAQDLVERLNLQLARPIGNDA